MAGTQHIDKALILIKGIKGIFIHRILFGEVGEILYSSLTWLT
jgi:hypothetical protein